MSSGAAGSLLGAGEVALPQYRALEFLAYLGPQRAVTSRPCLASMRRGGRGAPSTYLAIGLADAL